MGRGGLFVIVLAFYSDVLSLNPAGLKFSVQKDENKKEAGVGPSLKNSFNVAA